MLRNRDMLYLAIGILGATVMPHNLYLHSSIVQTRAFGRDVEAETRSHPLRHARFHAGAGVFAFSSTPPFWCWAPRRFIIAD